LAKSEFDQTAAEARVSYYLGSMGASIRKGETVADLNHETTAAGDRRRQEKADRVLPGAPAKGEAGKPQGKVGGEIT
jgi:hypothetical protein